jgi:peptidoglycan/LPS O-acetylase OafA/YrhL
VATAIPSIEPAPSPAVAPPPGNPRFVLFDSLRAIAALAILVFHVAAITGALEDAVTGDLLAVLGSRGVMLFFLISGFLLYRPFVAARAEGRPRPRVRRYFRRRVLRIVPAYWTALTLLAIFPGIVGVFTGDWWRYYFFLQLYSPDTVGGGIPVAWSLSVEVSFYLALPLWAFLVGRLIAPRPRSWMRIELAGLALLAALGIAVQVAADRQLVSDIVGASLLGQCAWFALGMALAVASVAVRPGNAHDAPAVRFVVEHPGLCWIGSAAAFAGLAALLQPGGLLGIVQALNTRQPVTETLGAAALTSAWAVLLVAPAVFGQGAGGLPRRVLAAPPLLWLGLVSYGIFLWHLTIAEFLALPADPLHFSEPGLSLLEDIPRAATPILFVLTLAVTSVVAAASYYLVELPFLRRKEG